MNTTQCRLCLADIPHDYDHALEVSLENGPIEAWTKVDIEPLTVPRTWPDDQTTVEITYLLFVVDLSLLNSYLILWELLDSCVDSEKRTALVIGMYAVNIICLALNAVVGQLVLRKFKSWIIFVVCLIFGSLSFLILIKSIWDFSIHPSLT